MIKIVYFAHYRNFKFYVNEGVKVTETKKNMIFKLKAIFKEYIGLNTNLRAKAN